MPTESVEDSYAEIPELYDHVPAHNSRTDVEFYVDLCREAGDALEVGCGTGRVLIPAASSGSVVTGIDRSSQMLARCRTKVDALPAAAGARVTLIEADMTSFQLSRTFKLIIAPFRPIQHLITVDEQLSFLQCVHRHLEPGGKFVFDVFHPNLASLARPGSPDEVEETPEFSLPDGRRFRRTFRLPRKHYAEQCVDCELIYYLDGRRIVQAFAMHYFFRFEMEHLLTRAGFEIAALYGSFDGSHFVDDSPEMIFTAVRT
jgi:SAM-dependent methyltransferase